MVAARLQKEYGFQNTASDGSSLVGDCETVLDDCTRIDISDFLSIADNQAVMQHSPHHPRDMCVNGLLTYLSERLSCLNQISNTSKTDEDAGTRCSYDTF